MNKIIFAFVMFLITSTVFSQWIQQQSGTTQNLMDICFINENSGIAVGYSGTIIRTSNGGTNWYIVTVPTSQNIFSTCFPSETTGYASGYTGFVVKSTTYGIIWNNASPCGINVCSISFLNSNTGITGGGGNLMCFTSDGGASFNPRYTPTSHFVTGIHYVSSSLLLVTATNSSGACIHRSTNGGINFTTVINMTNSGNQYVYTINAIYFRNENTGIAVGSYSTYGMSCGQIYRSTNGGVVWSGYSVAVLDTGICLSAVYFPDSATVYTIGNKGMILKSVNTGINYVKQISGTSNQLNGIHMINSSTGYICGSGGVILKTTNGGVVGITPVNNKIPDKFALYQNYPNPFNPSTVIKFQVASSKLVKITVYDVLGKEVVTLVNEKLSPGNYEVDWNAETYPSGTYIYKLITDNYSETKKMVLLK